ncbi:hypothetical protein HPB52_004756 [Rhipicephalus sanguineus]|uniref:Uncharacterized protein n=1 Tax=Rhipicephalus sanguineus TaxID=34632 RepID=A0A9D4QAC6_RHISA|nr:hypothetical protein HPB52_004756 [Rhipicephalus sanguineus]
MASYHHVTSTDEEPHHDLCPEDALLPIYERLLQASLLQRCLGAKTQNASEAFHSVLWSLMPKEQHASLIAVETALHDAVLRYNAGCYRATQELASSVGLTPGHLAIQRAAEKDSVLEATSQDGLKAGIQLPIQFIPPAAGSTLVEEVTLLIVPCTQHH